MAHSIKSIRGMSDMLPSAGPYWQHLEQVCASLAQSFAYREIRFPIVEMTSLFKRAVGEVTDIVEKEMYTFDDRNGDSLSLRPEGTASCVRAALQAGLLHNQVQKLWYLGPMFRHERPQKGRYRQFHQFGVEAYGLSSVAVEVEQLLLARSILDELGLLDVVTLEVNTLGSFETRALYRERLVTFFSTYRDSLDEDSKRRLQTNPLRILDSKNPAMKEIVADAPRLLDHLDSNSQAHFDAFCQLLTDVGVSYTVNSTMVRGLDYYCHTVYEWTTRELGAQGTICAGGRYDGLVEKLGGKSIPATGFAMGMERLLLLLQQSRTLDSGPDAYVVCLSNNAMAEGLILGDKLRSQVSGCKIEVDLSGASAKSQFKKADKSGARFALVLADDEISQQCITVKSLRDKLPQQQMSFPQLVELLV